MTVRIESNRVLIEGSVKTLNEFREVQDQIETVLKNSPERLELEMMDSELLTSSMIGYLLKLAKKDHVAIHVKTNSRELKRFVAMMKLESVLKLEMVG